MIDIEKCAKVDAYRFFYGLPPTQVALSSLQNKINENKINDYQQYLVTREKMIVTLVKAVHHKYGESLDEYHARTSGIRDAYKDLTSEKIKDLSEKKPPTHQKDIKDTLISIYHPFNGSFNYLFLIVFSSIAFLFGILYGNHVFSGKIKNTLNLFSRILLASLIILPPLFFYFLLLQQE